MCHPNLGRRRFAGADLDGGQAYRREGHVLRRCALTLRDECRVVHLVAAAWQLGRTALDELQGDEVKEAEITSPIQSNLSALGRSRFPPSARHRKTYAFSRFSPLRLPPASDASSQAPRMRARCASPTVASSGYSSRSSSRFPSHGNTARPLLCAWHASGQRYGTEGTLSTPPRPQPTQPRFLQCFCLAVFSPNLGVASELFLREIKKNHRDLHQLSHPVTPLRGARVREQNREE